MTYPGPCKCELIKCECGDCIRRINNCTCPCHAAFWEEDQFWDGYQPGDIAKLLEE